MTAAPLREGTYQAARLEAVARPKRHLLVRSPEIGGLDSRSRAMRREDPYRDRRDEQVRDDDRHESNRSRGAGSGTVRAYGSARSERPRE